MASPFTTSLPRRGLLAAALGTALIAAGCSKDKAASPTTSAPSSAAGSASSTTAAAFPVTVKDVYGSVTIEKKATKVVTLGWGSVDAAIALGTIPVGIPRSSWGDDDGDGFLEWTKEAITKAGGTLPALHDETDGIPFDKLAPLAPDLILATNSGVTQQEYATLTKMAPTVAYPKTAWGTSWRDSTTLIGESLGAKNEAAALITATEKTMADEMGKYPQIKGKTVMMIWVDVKDAGKVQYYTPNDTRIQYLADLGLTIAPSIVELSKGQQGFVASISAEQADKLDADIAVIYVQGGTVADLAKNALLSKIPAIASGAVVPVGLDAQLMAISAPTVLSIPWALPTYAKQLGEAAAKVK